jgi:hypothetical protein
MQSRFAGSWCGWRRTLVRVASGVVCVDLCHVISLSSLYTALSIYYRPNWNCIQQPWNLTLRTNIRVPEE